jgi:outer membrane protein, heavy metal efflux system
MIDLSLRTRCAKNTGLRAAGLALACAAFALPVTAEILPLSVALRRAAQADPSVVASEQRLRAAEANVRQARVKPNPTIVLEVEDALGSGPYSGIDMAETTLSYEQPVERGNKRSARVGVASAQRDLVIAQSRVRTWDIMADVHTLWIEATVADAEVRLAEDRLKMAKDAQGEIGRRVDAARDPLFAGSLANADVSTAQIAFDQAKANARQLKLQLAGRWGGGVDFELDPAWLEDLSAAKSTSAIMETPDIALLRAQQKVASSEIAVESSRRVQDPTFQAGIRHYKADDAFAFVVGGSIPLGRNDTNQGAIERSRLEASAAAADIETAERIRARDIAASSLRLYNYAEEVRRIDAEVIPHAERAVLQVREGFARGGFTYRDVMGAQEVLMAAKTRRLEILKSFQLERANRERLAGQWVPLIPTTEVAQ